MIVVDTSAIITILRQETGFEAYQMRIADAPQAFVSSATMAEASIVEIGRKGRDGLMALDLLVDALGLTVQPFAVSMLPSLRDGFMRYFKGQGHRAQLNFGDCFSYALAKSMNLPLLFKGEDFAHTDIVSALS